MPSYNHKEIEPKWQKKWEEDQIYRASHNSGKSKKYVLVEFPYPSGEGLHMGHLRPYTAGDVYSRFHRMNGNETLYPMGWDAFGLPAENYAIKKAVHPRVSTAKNIENAKRQLKSWGMGFDWSREINTTDPEYYKWTQWIFLQFFKAGLAYEATGLINWCPKDKTGLANEEVIDGKCERCGTLVEKKNLRQWYLKITAYAEKLLEGLKELPEWTDPVKIQQENWIGKKEGINITYAIENSKETVTCFTTRPDTNFGATFVVIGPEHPLIESQKILNLDLKIWKEIQEYKSKVENEAEELRTALDRKKTGVFTGLYAINELNGYKMPLYVADYVLGNVGTGAVVGVPGHDKRDFEFARDFHILVVRVVQKEKNDNAPITSLEQVQEDEGFMVNSDFLDGLDIHEATQKIMYYMEEKGYGKKIVNYKLRDWVFSRQRYWGEPIPIIHCEKCGVVPVPEDELPVTLPEVEKYEPTGTGESPLATIDSWVNVKCPNCEGEAKRETNTMPQWAGSSWYWLRYTDPNNDKKFVDKKLLKYWTPVDVYFGGMEHTTLHLLYSRFWNLFLYDQELVTAKEPYLKRVPHGIILATDGEKMSKSRGNVVNPDDIVEKFGADTMRMYELFLGPHESMVSWSDKGIIGVKRFLDKVWRSANSILSSPLTGEDGRRPDEGGINIHRLIKKITNDIVAFKFNTAIAAFMSFLNDNKEISKNDWEVFLKLLAPFAPHLTEELWQQLGHKDSIHKQPWPSFDEKMIKEENTTVIVQVNGRMRASLELPVGTDQVEVSGKAKASENVQKYLERKQIVKEIFVKDKLINFVTN